MSPATRISDEEVKDLPKLEKGQADFEIFSIRLLATLEANDKAYVLDRESDTPAEDASDLVKQTMAAEALTRNKDDRIVKALLLKKVSPTLVHLIAREPTAFAMWRKLKETFDVSNAYSLVGWMDELFDIEYKSTEDFPKHLANILRLTGQLKRSGKADWDLLAAIILLRSMPKSSEWSATVQSLKANEAGTLNIDKISAILMQRASELNGNKQEKAESKKAAFLLKDKLGKNQCSNCKKNGHWRRDCTAPGGGKAPKKPEDTTKPAKSTTDKNTISFSYLSYSTRDTEFLTKGSPRIISDGGSGYSYVNDPKLLHGMKPMKDVCRVGSGESLQVTACGSIHFRAKLDGDTQHVVEIKNVRLVPELAANLLSELELEDKGLEIRSKDKVRKFMANDREVMRATRSETGGHYYLQGEFIPANEDVKQDMTLVTGDDKALLLHQRLNCLGIRNMERLIRDNMVDGLDVKLPIKEFVCDICQMGKAVRTKFVESTNPRARRPMDLIHMDILEIPKSRRGERYALVLTDDHSACKFVLGMKRKSDTESVFKEWMIWAERMTDRKIKVIRSDNAREFIYGDFGKFCAQIQVIREFILPYEHEQHGTAERSNRSLCDKARCALLRAKLPNTFAMDALHHSAFVANRSPVSNIKFFCPIEAFTGIKPNIRKLRVFGSMCWIKHYKHTTERRRKFEARAYPARFMYYGQGGHLYICLTPEGNEVEAIHV